MVRQPGYAPKKDLQEEQGAPDQATEEKLSPSHEELLETQQTSEQFNASSIKKENIPELPQETARQPGHAPPEVEPQAVPPQVDKKLSKNLETMIQTSSDSEKLPTLGLVRGALIFGGLVLGLILLNQWISLWQSHWIWGLLGTAVLLGSSALIYRIWQHEVDALDRISQLKPQQEAVREALEKKDLHSLKKHLEPWLKMQESSIPEQIKKFRSAATERKTCEEYWSLYQKMVLEELDAKAQKLVRHYVMTTTAAVMVVPHPALDAVVLLWRSRSMVSAIANVYGVETTTLSSLRLFKQALVTVGIVAGIEGITQEQLLQEGSNELQTRIASIGSQGAITVLRTYKLAQLTKLACKPFDSSC